MEATFWRQRWAENAIGFHRDDVNPNLVKHFDVLAVPKGGCIFVPLCGKSQDLLWLAQQGIEVVGAELSEKAVEAFFSENKMTPEVKRFDHMERWRCDNITIYRSDFFDLIPELFEHIDAVYDRAALVALPKAMRSDYCRQLNYLIPEPLNALLVSFDYDQEKMDGPPFSVPAYEVRYHFGDIVPITPLSSTDIIAEVPRFAEKGLDTMHEEVYFLGYPRR